MNRRSLKTAAGKTGRYGVLRGAIAVGAAVFGTIVLVLLLGDGDSKAITYILAGPLMSRLSLGNTLAATSRLMIAGTAAALAFRSGIFNLGGEGQALAGGLAVSALAVHIPGMSGILALPLAMVIGLVAGAALGGASGLMKARWNVDELISSFLISSAALPVGHYLLSGPMKDPGSYLIAAPALSSNWRLAQWMPPSRLGAGLVWALVTVVLAWVFLRYSRQGYHWRIRGANEDFARYGGIRTGLVAAGSLSVSGALFGLSGAVALLDSGQAVQGFSGGLGWDGLAVALIAGSRPEWIPLAALAYAWLTEGTRAAMISTGFPYSLSGLVQAAVFLLITAERLYRMRRKN